MDARQSFIAGLVALAACQKEIDVAVIQEPPQVLIVEPEDGAVFTEGQTVLFHAVTRVTDGSRFDELVAVWDSGAKVFCPLTAVPNSGEPTCEVPLLDAGTLEVTITVTDPQGDVATDTVSITVRENNAPTISVSEPFDGEVVPAEGFVALHAIVSDEEDDEDELTVTVLSSVDGDLLLTDAPEPNGSWDAVSELSPGIHLLTFTVTDSGGKTDSEDVTLEVNSPPNAPVIEVEPKDPITGEEVVVDVTTPSVDPEGKAVSYSFAWTRDGTAFGTPSSDALLDAGTVFRGEYWEVSATASDGVNTTAPVTKSFTVGNAVPSITKCDISPSAPLTDDDLVAVPSGWTDAEADSELYQYAWFVWNNGAWVSVGINDFVLARGITDRGEIFRVECTPWDGIEAGATRVSPQVTITNSLPTLTSCELDPEDPNVEDNLVASALGFSDDDDDLPVLTYRWYIDGIEDEAVTGDTYPQGGVTSGHDVQVECIPSDGTDEGDSEWSNVVAVLNAPPGRPEVSIEPAEPVTGDALTAVIDVEAVDPDGDSIGYTYTWSQNGTEVYVGPTVPADWVFRGEEWEVAVVADDGQETGPSGRASVQIGNAAPTITGCELDPLVAGVETDLSAIHIGYSDPENDPPEPIYRWYLNQGAGFLDLGLSDETLGHGLAEIGDLVRAKCTPNDGELDGTPIESAAVSITNTPPWVGDCLLEPGDADTIEDLAATADDPYDPDDDPIEVAYAWYKDGVLQPDLEDDWVSAALTTHFESWVVGCLPSDAHGDGDEVLSAPVVIANSPPTDVFAYLTPSSPRAGEKLSVIIDLGASDFDLDPVTYEYSWRRDATAFDNPTTPTTKSTVNNGITHRDEQWEVDVVPTDGFDPGPASTLVVQVGNGLPTVDACLVAEGMNVASTDDLHAAHGTTSDPDGDPVDVEYAWELEWQGTWNPLPYTDTLPASETERGNRLRVACTPWDGFEYGATVYSSPTAVENDPPSITDCSIAPVEPYDTSDDIVAVPAGWSDPDGDPPTYRFVWRRNGVVDLLETTDTYPASKTTRGDDFQADCVPIDAFSEGTPETTGTETVVNAPPTAPVIEITPSDPASGDSLTATITTESVDADGDLVTLAWSWTVDGTSYPSTTASIVPGVIAIGEIWEVQVQTSDPYGPGGLGVDQVLVGNAVPTITGCAIAPANAGTLDALQVTAYGWQDPENDPQNVKFSWQRYRGGTWAPVGVGASLLTADYTERDDKFKVNCLPQDPYGTGPMVVSGEVPIGNTLPSITACDLTTYGPYDTGDDLIVKLVGWDDPDGDPSTATYAWYKNNVPDPSVQAGVYPSTKTSRYDKIRVECTPKDGYGSGTVVSSATVEVGNCAPTAPVVSISPSAPRAGEALVWQIDTASTDCDDTNLTYTVTWYVDGVPYSDAVPGDDVPAWVTHRDETWELRVAAHDGSQSGPEGTASTDIDNALPTLDTCDIGPSDAGTNDDLLATPGTADDWDGDDVDFLYVWQKKNGSTWTTLTYTADTLPQTVTSRGDVFRLTCTPTDGTENGTPVVSPNFTVSDAAPSVAGCSIESQDGTDYGTAEDIVASAWGFQDDDGDPQQYGYQWYVNGVLDGSVSTNTYPASKTTRGMTIYATCHGVDGSGLGPGVQSGSEIIVNTPPTTPVVSITDPATSADTLVATLTTAATDLDGDPVTYRYYWFKNNAPVNNPTHPTSNAQADGSLTARGEYWEVRVTGFDGLDEGSAGTDGVIPGNAKPSLGVCGIGPPSPKTTDDLTVTPTGWYDADGDPQDVQLTWWKNVSGTWTDTGHTASTFPNSQTTTGESYKAKCTPKDSYGAGTTVESAVLTIGNTVASITGCSLAANAPYQTQNPVVAVPSGWSDAENDPPSYVYRWYVNDVLQPTDTTASLPESRHQKGDLVRADCIPVDPGGQGQPVGSPAVQIQNTLPGAPVVRIDPDPVAAGAVIGATILTGASDPDPMDTLTYWYYWRQNGVPYGTFPTLSSTVPASVTKRADTWTVEVRAHDGTGEGVIGSDTITIGNAPPSLATCGVTPTQPGTDATLTANPLGWSDYDNDTAQYRYKWFEKSGSTWVDTGVTTATLDKSYTTKGDVFRLECTPFDGTSTGTMVPSADVTIVNTAPVATACTLAPQSPLTSDDIVASGSGLADADGDPSRFYMRWFLNGIEQTSYGGGNNFSSTLTKKNDTVQAYCVPTDDINDGEYVSSAVRTIGNTAPTAPSITISPSAPTSGQSLTVTITSPATDPDGDGFVYWYWWQRNGSSFGNPTYPSTSPTIASGTTGRGETWSVTVRANDGTTDGAAALASVVPANSPPSITGCSVSPGSPVTGDTLTANPAGWTDFDGDPEGYTWSWEKKVGGSWSSTGVTSKTFPASSTTRGDEFRVKCTPIDGMNGGSTITSASVTIGNTPPSVSLCSIKPGTPYTTVDNIVATYGGWADADGDTANVTYAWYRNGSLDASVTGASYPASKQYKHDQMRAECVPRDTYGQGNPVSSDIEIVVNTKPTTPAVDLTPNSPTAGAGLTATITTFSTDADGDGLTYRIYWQRNGAAYANPTYPSDLLTLTSNVTRRGEAWSVIVAAWDGEAEGGTASDVVSVSNSLPSILDVDLAPSDPVTSDDLTATPVGWYDYDGDTESYTRKWYRNGSQVTAETGATFPASKTTRGDNIYVVVTPVDTFGSGTPKTSNTVTVINDVPSTPGVTATPDPAVVTDSLTCNLVTPSTDADAPGDTISYDYIWKNNDGKPTVSGSVLSWTKTDLGDTWWCEVTAYDGLEYSAPGMSNVLVITDLSAPPAPVISSSWPRTRDSSSATISGTCEAGCSLNVVCNDNDESWVQNQTCSGSGTFSDTVVFDSGQTTTCFTTCTDGWGNTSAASSTVTTERCATIDPYETSGTYGDSLGSPVDAWGTLMDDGSDFTITANVTAEDASDDWYLVRARDDVNADNSAGIDYYHFTALLSAGSSNYKMLVHKNGSLSCSGQFGTGYTTFEDFVRDNGDGNHAPPGDNRYCKNGSSTRNNCTDFDADYYVQIVRTSATTTCATYSVRISNGEW